MKSKAHRSKVIPRPLHLPAQVGRPKLGRALIGGALVAGFYLYHRHQHKAYTFAGKVVVITGGSRGLGLVLARQLVAEGARVALIARDAAELARARQDLLARGADEDQVLTLTADVREQPSIQAAIQHAHQKLEQIDVLINAAGLISTGPLQHLQVSDYQQQMDTHFWGALYASRAALPAMRQQGYGRIVNIASLAGRMALPHMGAYSASKAALVSLSQNMRAELAAENIRVTVVCPGPMRTGAHVNAVYKGRHREEFAGLTLLSSLPFVSTDARLAARRILDACRKGQALLVFPHLFNSLPLLYQLSPDIASRLLSVVNQLEPAPIPAPNTGEGDVLKEGWACLSPLAPSILTRWGDRATVENNGLRGHAPLVPEA